MRNWSAATLLLCLLGAAAAGAYGPAMPLAAFAMLLTGVLTVSIWISARHERTRRRHDAIAQKNRELAQTLVERDAEIARRAELEEHLRLAIAAADQANRAKNQFLATMSRELRTPLNAIIGFSEILAHAPVTGPQFKDYAQDINSSGQNLLTILNDILDMARIDAGAVRLAEDDVLLGDVIERAVQDVAADNRLPSKTVRVEPGSGYIAIRADAKRLGQVLVNLLSNAVKFTGDDARIDVRIEVVADGVDIVVSDNGVGIPQDRLASAFEAFGRPESTYARVHGGIGLGLPIVKALVRLHGGRFCVESEVNEGTSARVHLPMERVLKAARRDAAAA